MYFPWNKYEELPISRRDTLQIFITNRCNLKCPGCFARKVMTDSQDISQDEYLKCIDVAVTKGVKQINLLGGEPLLHPCLEFMIESNKFYDLRTTIYTNGYYLNLFLEKDLHDAKLRVSIYSKNNLKGINKLGKISIPFDANFMVGKNTTSDEMLEVANISEIIYGCKVFFISSIRELDNPNREFFEDTGRTMPVLKYKELVHEFLKDYTGNMEIHISKRGVFESTKTLPDNKCHFANYFIGGKVIQCPYDVVNLKYQSDYSFGVRNCQQNNTCLMSKIVLKPIKGI